MSSVIPVDIIASEILPRLPPTTLLRLKCLNKFFYKYISSKQFVDLHLRHSASSNTNGLVIVFTGVSSCQYLYLLDVDSPDSSGRYITLPQPFRCPHRCLKVVGSCNGLLCLNSSLVFGVNLMYYAMVLNPSTGEVLINTSLSTEFWNVTYSGFGYDSLNDDYKIVVVEYQYHYGPLDLIDVYRKTSVFSIKSSSWRCIAMTYLGDVHMRIQDTRPACVLIGNNMHWLLISSGTGKRTVVCFNLESEQWTSDVALPDFVNFVCRFGYQVDLGVLDGCLFLSVYEDRQLNVWIMKEYGVQDSWTMFSVVVPCHHLYNPIFACDRTPIKEMLLTRKPGFRTYVWYKLRGEIAKESLEVSVRDNLGDVLSSSNSQLEAQLLCVGSLVTGFGDGQFEKHNQIQERMEVDNQVKVTTRQPGVMIMLSDAD